MHLFKAWSEVILLRVSEATNETPEMIGSAMPFKTLSAMNWSWIFFFKNKEVIGSQIYPLCFGKSTYGVDL